MEGGIRLSQISESGLFTILDIDGIDTSMEDRLLQMGFLPGRDLKLVLVISRKGVRVIRLGRSEIALDMEMSDAIIVGDRR